ETKADETNTATAGPAAEITKVADPKTFTKPGTVTYTYTVKNTGNVTLTGLSVNDDKLGEVELKKTTLAPGESTTGTKTYEVTQADIDAGKAIQNVATLTADQAIPETKADETITMEQTPAASITKVADPKTFTKPGTVTYTYTVKNTGNVTLTGLEVNDDKLGEVALKKTTLAPGESTTGTKTYNVTQADIDAGKAIQNVATVTADQEIPETKADETVTVEQTPAAEISKTADQKTFTKPGTVTYTYTVKNTGNVTLTGLEVNDDKLGDVELKKTTLAPGESTTGTKTYYVTQDDIDAGITIKNVAVLTADQEIPDTRADETITATAGPAVEITKVADPKTFTKPGTVTYTYTVTNTGNVTLTGLEVNDDKLGEVELKKTTLAPGESTTGTKTYSVTQDDIDAGKVIKNVATLTADQEIPETKTDETITVEQTPAAQITKVADPKTFSKPGTVTYTYTVTNTGNVTLTGLTVNDDKLGEVELKKTTLAPGESTTGTKTYYVSQDDIDAGKAITNVATVTADQEIPETKTDETITVKQTPAAQITKEADQKTFTKPGTVTYTYTVTNTGNVTLTGLTVNDDKLGEVTLKKTTLAPGESTTGTKTYNVTQDDIDAGQAIKNVATLTADQEIPETKADETITATSGPAAEITKVADQKTFTKPGTVTYTYTVKNTGNVTLTGLTVNDDKLGEVELKKTTLAPGESTTGTKTYEVTQEDIDAGTAIKNIATVTADQSLPEIRDDETVTVTQNPGMKITKEANKEKFTAVDEVITYTITVKNTGNVTLEGVVVTDTLVTLTDEMRTESKAEDGKLEVGETWTYVYDYKVTQDDMDAGIVRNVVKATNPDFPDDDPDNPPPTDEEEVPGEPKPGMAITKEANKETFTAVDEVITYTITVKNTGNVTLEGVVVTDTLVTLTDDMRTESKAEDGKLEVGETWTYVYDYKVTQDDMDAGIVRNVVKATNPDFPDDDPDNPPPTDEEEVPGEPKPGMTITKEANKEMFTAVDEVITYTITVKNTGNVTLEGVVVTDTLVTLTDEMRTESKAEDGKLEVGETWTYVYNYKVTQDDMDAGIVRNVVKATNPDFPDDDPDNPPPTDEEEVFKPLFTVLKEAAEERYYLAGDTIHYTVTVTNIADVAVKALVVEDSLVDFSDMVLTESVNQNGDLDVGEVWTLTYSHQVTAEDVARGSVLNRVTVTNPADPDRPIKDETEVFRPSFTVDKKAAEDRFRRAGDVIHYTLTVTNTGRVAISDLVVEDSLVDFADMTLAENLVANKVLDADETWTLTYAYTVKEADVAVGHVLNSVTVTDPADPENPEEDEVTVPKSSFKVVKKVDEPEFYNAGDTLHYTIVVTNTGKVAIHDLVVEDNLVALADMKLVESVTQNGVLDVGETWTLTYSYLVTEADAAAGCVLNKVIVIELIDPKNPVEDEVETPEVSDPSTPEPVPRTGRDDSQWGMWLGLVLLSAGVALLLLRKKGFLKPKNEE
ncbi:MAG: LPXTG cell wall anchor domain-containing protein, partial [Bacillota bacterium]|nr:LPXTG cell wall anchor domain-containing protein [Bacillota bacterium]